MPTVSKSDRVISAARYLLREQIATAITETNRQWQAMTDLDTSIERDEKFLPDVRQTLAALQQIRDTQGAVAEALDGVAALLYSAGVGKARVAAALGQNRATVSRRLDGHPLSDLDDLAVERADSDDEVKRWRLAPPDSGKSPDESPVQESHVTSGPSERHI